MNSKKFFILNCLTFGLPFGFLLSLGKVYTLLLEYILVDLFFYLLEYIIE